MKRLILCLNQTGNVRCRFPVHFILALGSVGLLVGTALSTGCASPTQQAAERTRQKEAVLQQCGFKAVPITTPQQAQQLGTLPPGKISIVQRNGTKYYVFPDPPRQMLYVGHYDEYLLYKNYVSIQAENAKFDAIAESDVGWDDGSWGSWDAN